MTPDYLRYVQRIAAAFEDAKLVPAREIPPAATRPADAPCVALIMPHPDDECITGALALRVWRECGARVVNLAVTLGSNRARKEARREELRAACALLGFEPIIVGATGLGLDAVTPATRENDPARWREHVQQLATELRRLAPRIVVAPHAHDWHPTHIGCHWLALDALATLPASQRCTLIETEFWFPMDTPNLAVETSVADTAALVAAIACHRGEVQRNPYHLRLPAWMMDNVRRMELLGGAGTAAPRALFATLYRLRVREHGTLQPARATVQLIGVDDRAALRALLAP